MRSRDDGAHNPLEELMPNEETNRKSSHGQTLSMLNEALEYCIIDIDQCVATEINTKTLKRKNNDR